ncbi:MAG: lysophospholipid acyltransferase family protein [Pseudomonadota bacterium]
MPADQPSYKPGLFGRGFLRLLGLVPVPAIALLGYVFGWLAWKLDRRRRHIVRTNLALCFPELSEHARNDLMRRHFLVFGRALLCALAVGAGSRARLYRTVTIEGRQHYDEALAKGRGVILYAPHFTALEVGGLRITAERPMLAMYREPRRHLFHWGIHRNRTHFGLELIEREANMRHVIRRLGGGTPFYYLPDIDPGHSGSHAFVPFFGIPAATVTAVSRLAKLANALVIPCITRETGLGRYTARLYPPVEGVSGENPQADAALLNRWLENEVRRTPEQYFWIHRRFKTRPAGEPSLYERRAPRA